MLNLGISVGVRWRQLTAMCCRLSYRLQQTAAASILPKSVCYDSEYAEEANYPQIQDLSFKSRKQYEKNYWHDQIRKVPTVEEKLIKMNMPRYYGYKVFLLNETKVPYNCLPAMQHYTRTIYEEVKNFPEESTHPQEYKQKLEENVQTVKSDLKDGIEHAYDYFSHEYANVAEIEPRDREQIFAKLIVEQVNRTLINVLSGDYVHLQEVEVDYSPRHEAFWSVGGINPPKNVVKSKTGRKWQKEMANDPYDRFLQYTGRPYLAVRHRNQLQTWKRDDECTNEDLAKQIPRYNYDPRTLGYVCGHQHVTNIPGFWPGSVNVFGNISYQSRAFLQIRPETYGAEDFKEALHAHAIQSSYAWLLSQASYNGFNTFNDITYPMNTQTVLTNGRDWSFYEYQLNTLLLHSHYIDDNPRVNFCRGTAEMQLFSEINDSGKCTDLNEDVVRYLVRFYTNLPSVQRPLRELQPYLGTEVKHIADYDNVQQREFLERIYKHIVSNRPRHLEIPEIYLWEKIYKIDNKTRQMDPKRRYFELDINPWKRTLDQHQKEYIPRVVRPEGPKSKKKWKETFYP